MAAAYRCATCGQEYPMSSEFTICAVCEERCQTVSAGKPMSFDAARSVKAHGVFERRYAAREAERDGPSPEDIGMAEARELARQWRQIEAVYEQG